MDKENGKSISRRDFFKIAGAAGVVTAGLVGCNKQSKSSSNVIGEPDGDMTYRILTGDRVSLLGYGCMRWPMISNPDGEGQIVPRHYPLSPWRAGRCRAPVRQSDKANL